MLKLISKLKAIQSAFATQKVTLNGKKVPNFLDTSNFTEIRVVIAEKPKTLVKKNKKRKNQNDNWGCNNFNWSSLCNRDSSNCSHSLQPHCTKN